MTATSKKCFVYVGTYTNGNSEGIYIYDMDIFTGELVSAGVASGVENPSYLAVSRDGKYLYSVAETDEFNGRQGGAVAAFSVDCRTGGLQLLNMQPSGGRAPCHVSVDSQRKYLFAANYREGTVSVYPIASDGSLGQTSCFIHHQGFGPDKERQEQPHVHYVTLTPEENFLCAVDLGIDKIVTYRFDRNEGRINPIEDLSVRIKPGSGPRHMVFHPGGRFAYLLNELTSDIVAMEYSQTAFNTLQYISALPADYSATSYGAAIHISTDGRFLYASNRGHDSIASFEVDRGSGKLKLLAHTSTGGNFPRDFAIDPTGSFLFAANQYSGSIVTFKVVPESGELVPTGSVIDVPDPVCIKFVVSEDM